MTAETAPAVDNDYTEAHRYVANWRPLSPAERVLFEAEFCGPRE